MGKMCTGRLEHVNDLPTADVIYISSNVQCKLSNKQRNPKNISNHIFKNYQKQPHRVGLLILRKRKHLKKLLSLFNLRKVRW